MKSGRRRAASWKVGAAAVAVACGAGLGAPSEAHAGDGAAIGTVAVLVGGLVVTDVAFAVHDIDAASKNRLDRDGWLIAETVVSAPQTLVFNGLLVAFNASDRQMAEIATFIGVLPTAGVSALTVHGAWGLADDKVPADALAGVSMLVGTNLALTASALGRAADGHFHSRPVGGLEMALSAPGLGVGIYESTFARKEQGAWIALTAWSGALLAHGLVSVIVNGGQRDPVEQPIETEAPASRELKRASKTTWWPQSFAVAPTVVSDGVGRAPGLMAMGTF